MLNLSPLRHLPYCPLAVVCLLWTGILTAQRSIGFLRNESHVSVREAAASGAESPVEAFTFSRNLIFFEAVVDGHPGNFILDTGAPTLIVNDRGAGAGMGSHTGVGAGGSVQLTDHRISSFEMGGRAIDNYWAVGLDLRDMERRTNARIDGFVGYDLLNSGELRIDYGRRTFQLLPSLRRPTHAGRVPRAVLKFVLVDHLPVVQVRIEGKKYYFAIDTGAGSNLIDDALTGGAFTQPTGALINIQGLDGNPVDCPLVTLAGTNSLPAGPQALEFVGIDLKHLQRKGSLPLAGILGSVFLSQYTVGIDYRRHKLYLW